MSSIISIFSSTLPSIFPSPHPLKIKTLAHLKQLHAHLITHHEHHHHLFPTLLAHCPHITAPLPYARQLFDQIPHPTPRCCAAIAKLYAALATPHQFLSLYADIRRRNLPIDAAIFPILFKSLGNAAHLAHAHVIQIGYAGDIYVNNAIISFYAKHGPIESARALFDEMPERRSIAGWNCMITGYWKWGRREEAFLLFHAMPERNVISWTAMVSGLLSVGELEMARRLFDKMGERSVVSWNVMLSGYVRSGRADEALVLFDLMIENGVRPNETTWVGVIAACSAMGDLKLAETFVGSLAERGIELNCFVRTALVDMYAKCGSLARAEEVFDKMEYRSSVAWNAMIAAYMREGDLPRANRMFERMPVKDVVSWNTMITGYAQNGRWGVAIELFEEMIVVKGLRPDEVTVSSVISACGQLGSLEVGRWVVDYIKRNLFKLSISGYNALIFMYMRCGSLEDAKRVFEDMTEKNVSSYNSLLSGFASYGDALASLELLKRMKKEHIEPDHITYMGILTACSHGGLPEIGCKVFRTIKFPTVKQYGCMVDLLGRFGRLKEAKQLIEDMPVKLQAGVYGALLNACCIHRCVEIGEFAANELFELEPEDSCNYILLSNIYASVGRWEDVANVRRTMNERGIMKIVGCSWLEFGTEVHRFVAGDRSHCQSEEIYRVLKNVERKMRALGYVADKSCVIWDVEEEEKEEMVGSHSEKLAVGFGLLVLEPRAVIRVMKNLRICEDCHLVMKMISEIEGREIVVRDTNRFHCFKDGRCSCKDYW